MSITDLDIRNQDFGRSLRGFNTDEVTAFLDTVADAFEQVTREKTELEERVRNLEATVKHYKDVEGTLQDALVTAQKATEELRENARREAELTLREARISADSEMEEARRKALQIKKDIVDLRSYKETFIARLRALYRSQMEVIQAFEREEDEVPLTSLEERRGRDTPSPTFPLSEDSGEGYSAAKR